MFQRKNPCYDTSSGCGWRRRPPDTEGGCEKQLRRVDKGWSSNFGVGRWAKTPHLKKQLLTKCYTEHSPWIIWDGLGDGK